MSRRCIGHIDGHSLWEDEGPGAARVMGHGGRMLLAGDLVTAKPNPAQRGALSIVTDTERASRQRRQERKMAAIRARELGGVYFPNTPRCGELLRYIKEPCARLAGHADHHRSRASLEADNARRRSA